MIETISETIELLSKRIEKIENEIKRQNNIISKLNNEHINSVEERTKNQQITNNFWGFL